MSALWTERTAPLASIRVSSVGSRTMTPASSRAPPRRWSSMEAMRARSTTAASRASGRTIWARKLPAERRTHRVVEGQRRVVEAGRGRVAYDGLGAQALNERLDEAERDGRHERDPVGRQTRREQRDLD